MGFIPKAKQNTAASSPYHSRLSDVQVGVEHQPTQVEKVIFTPSTKSKFLHTPAKQDVLSKNNRYCIVLLGFFLYMNVKISKIKRGVEKQIIYCFPV